MWIKGRRRIRLTTMDRSEEAVTFRDFSSRNVGKGNVAAAALFLHSFKSIVLWSVANVAERKSVDLAN